MLNDLESTHGSILTRRNHTYQFILIVDTRTTSFLAKFLTYFTIDLPLFLFTEARINYCVNHHFHVSFAFSTIIKKNK